MSIAKYEYNNGSANDNAMKIQGMPLLDYCKFIAGSQLVPRIYRDKPADIFLAVQMGTEIGLKPMQALKSISVINSVANIYGDAAIALVQSHPSFEDISEYFDDKVKAAVCIVKRKGQSEHKVIFSEEDARKAGLWGKAGPWSQYPKRMMQMRARGFALRDKFADALGGLILAEEAQDYPAVDVTPKTASLNTYLDSLLAKQGVVTNENVAIENSQDKMTDEIMEDAALESTTSEHSRLLNLLEVYSVSRELIDKWCSKAGVDTIEEMSIDKIQSCIEYILDKYQAA